MEYLFINAKIVLAIILLVFLPGLLLIFLLRARLSDLDAYEKVSFGLVAGMAFWVPISWLSYGLGMNSKVPIYLSLFITSFLVCRVLYTVNVNFHKTSYTNRHIFSYFNVYVLILIVQSILIGYTSQFQAGNSDALAHLAGLRNLATSETTINSDHVLGMNMPIVNTYGNNPWYLSLAMISKLANVETVFTYATITGVIYLFSILGIYTLLKAMSSDIVISKIGSLIFSLLSLIVWIKDNDYTTFNLNSHWIIFPQAIVNYVLFPIALAAFIRYILRRDCIYLCLTLLGLFAITRFHPNWLIWAPILISGIVVLWNIIGPKFGIKYSISYKVIIWTALIGFLSVMGFFISKNTFSTDPNLISPISLWRSSGGNLLYLSESIYFYDPLIYLKSRGYFDIFTIVMLWYLNRSGVKNTKELLVIFICFLVVVFLIIFNPLITAPFVKIFGTPIPLYRAFELIWPALSVFSIYSTLTLIQLKSKKYPILTRGIAIAVALLTLTYFGKNVSFLTGVYQNQGGNYSTNSSPLSEPFATLRTLDQGNIAVRTPMATPIASFTDLNPITTEKWRYPTLSDFEVRERENASILAFDRPYDELVSIVNRYKIRYVLIKNDDVSAVDNFNKHSNLIHFKVKAGGDQVWEFK